MGKVEDRHSGGGWVGKEDLQDILEWLGVVTPGNHAATSMWQPTFISNIITFLIFPDRDMYSYSFFLPLSCRAVVPHRLCVDL